MFDRIIKMIGITNFSKIQSTTVAIVGLGGVGGYAVESLARSGIQNFILVDYDTIDLTNLNRQIITNIENIHELKTNATEKRLLSINPKCQITKLTLKLTPDNIEQLFQYQFDYLVDACDTILVKEELIKRCVDANRKIISSMGTGNKLDPTKLEVVDIQKTSYDPIAKRIRKYIKDNHIKNKIPVVFSKEQNSKFKGDIPSMIFVPATSGLLCANYIIRDIISIEENFNKSNQDS